MDTKVIVPDFVSIAGSFVRDPDSANDIDVVVRARYDNRTGEFYLSAESLLLVIRNWMREHFDIGDRDIHLIFNPTGPHSDYIPLGTLLLRFDQMPKHEVKAGTGSEKLRIVFIGTGPAEPIEDDGDGRSNTSTLIALGKRAVLVDVPRSALDKVQAEGIVPQAILITHYHRDAISGLGEVSGLDVPVFGPPSGENATVPDHVKPVAELKPFTVGPFSITPVPVFHSDVPTFAYHIAAVGYPTVLVAHDVGKLTPELLNAVGDIVIFDGAGWGRAVGNGHMNVFEAIPMLKAHGASRIYLTQISRLVPENAADQLPEDVLIAKDGDAVEFERTAEKSDPNSRVIGSILPDIEREHKAPRNLPWPTRPAVPFYVEHFTPKQMWDAWGKDHAPFYVEPKWNGWRVLIDGPRHKAITESGMDVTKAIPEDLFIDNAVLDGELLFRRDGEIVPRHKLAAVTGNIPLDWESAPRIFDVLWYDGKTIGNLPYIRRREILERIVPKGYITPSALVSSMSDLEAAFNKMGYMAGSEGIVAKAPNSTAPGESTDEWAKIKRMLEVVVEVVAQERRKNGWVYLCKWKDGKEAGHTMVTRMEAKPGDTLTVVVQELVPVGDTLRFQNAVVTGVNERDAMTIDVARRLMRRAARKWFYGGPMPFAGFGSKAHVSDIITAIMADHDTYVEPFVGSGGYFFRRPKVAGILEVIGDTDPRKYLAFRALRDRPSLIGRIVEKARRSPVSRSELGTLHHKNPSSFSDALLTALRIRMHTARGFDNEWTFPSPAMTIAKPSPGTYYVASLRLQGVKILNEDALAVVKKYDSPRTLFYLDPPYPVEGDRYRIAWSVEDFVKLLNLLKGIRGKFILSCTPASFSAAKKAGFVVPRDWKITRIKVRTFTGDGQRKQKPEYLVTNYPPKRGAWLSSVKDRIIRLPSIRVFDDDWKTEYDKWRKLIAEANSKWRSNAGRRPANSGEGQKALPQESIGEDSDEPTRSEAARASWERMWVQHYPPSGTGRFVVQRHIRGIPESEKDLGLDKLAEKHSVHLDIRFSTKGGGNEHLFGFTIFVPDESKASALDDLASGKPMQCTPKLPQPVGWLWVGTNGPTWSEPGSVGATSKKYAVFEALDTGEYSAGVWNRHFVEIVLKGKRLKGRFAFQQIKSGTWVVQKMSTPPIAKRTSAEKLAARLKARGHREFVYRDPTTNEKPRFVKIAAAKHNREVAPALARAWSAYISLAARLTKRSPWIKILPGGWAIIPVTNAFADLVGDIVPIEEIKKIADEGKEIPLLLAHSPKVPLGHIVKYYRIGRFLFGLAKLNDLGVKVLKFISRYPEHPRIAPLGWGTSIGFKARRERDKDSSANILRDIDLQEVSILPTGQIANPWTGISA